MWPFKKNPNREFTAKIREALAGRFESAKTHGLTAVDVVSYDYLLGYIFAQLLVIIQYDYKNVRKGEEVNIGLMLLHPFVGITNIVWMRKRVEGYLKRSDSSEAFAHGFHVGNMVMRVAYEETSFDANPEVRAAKEQVYQDIPKEELAHVSEGGLAYIYLDQKLWYKWISDRFPTAEPVR